VRDCAVLHDFAQPAASRRPYSPPKAGAAPSLPSPARAAASLSSVLFPKRFLCSNCR
jgi:hypothetical protein